MRRLRRGSGADFFDDFLLDGDGDVFVFDVEAEAVVEAHIEVGDVDEGEPGDEIAAPARVEELETGDEEEEGCDVVREAVFAGEEVKELTLDSAAAVLTFALAKLARLAEDLLVGDGPRGTGNRDGEKKKKSELVRKREGQHERF